MRESESAILMYQSQKYVVLCTAIRNINSSLSSMLDAKTWNVFIYLCAFDSRRYVIGLNLVNHNDVFDTGSSSSNSRAILYIAQ